MCPIPLSKIGLGTSLLFNGKLKNNIDDSLRETFFRYALKKSNTIHTNPNLGTQKKVANVLAQIPSRKTYHITKLECDIDSLFNNNYSKLKYALTETRINCACCMPFAVSIEIDYKGNNTSLDKKWRILEWLKIAKAIIEEEFNYSPIVTFFCKSKLEFEIALEVDWVMYIGGYTNFVQSGLLSEAIYSSRICKPIIGYSPLSRGRLFELPFDEKKIMTISKKLGIDTTLTIYDIIRELSLRVILSNQNVQTLFAGIYNYQYLECIEKILSLPKIDNDESIEIFNSLSLTKTYGWY